MKFRERTSVICIAQVAGEDHLLCFRAVDPTSKQAYHFLPGGGLEPGETQIQCAERETWEETGYRVQVRAGSRISTRYPFHWDGQNFDCLTHFFRADLCEPWRPAGSVNDQAYNLGPLWIQTRQISELFSYGKEIQDCILQLI